MQYHIFGVYFPRPAQTGNEHYLARMEEVRLPNGDERPHVPFYGIFNDTGPPPNSAIHGYLDDHFGRSHIVELGLQGESFYFAQRYPRGSKGEIRFSFEKQADGSWRGERRTEDSTCESRCLITLIPDDFFSPRRK